MIVSRKLLMLGFFVGLAVCGCEHLAMGYQSVPEGVRIDISARDASASNCVEVEFAPGIYRIQVIGVGEGGAYNAWKPWFYPPTQDAQGRWEKGWVNSYTVASDEFAEMTYSDGLIHGTPEAALEGAVDSEFTLTRPGKVRFYTKDDPSFDNSGGISLLVSPVFPAAVP